MSADVLLGALLALTTVLIAGRLLGRLLVFLRQPPVIGEVLAGILLGPSALGRISADAPALILPPKVVPVLGVIAHVGLVLYMFLVGLELSVERIRERVRTIVVTTSASMAVPFALGLLVAPYLYPRFAANTVPAASFALFMGVAMSVTAFPVLARILTDRGIATTELGAIALACAAAGDVIAWCLLAFVVGVAGAEVRGALVVVALTVMFIAAMFLVVRPVAVRSLNRMDTTSPRTGMAIALAGLLVSSFVSDRIGIHAVFGAFLFGAIIPHDSLVARTLKSRVEQPVMLLLLPAFFALIGMRTDIGLMSSYWEWVVCGAIILLATAGKFGGTALAARLTGMDWRAAASLGVLMNTRGLMELVVLSIGLDLGVISPTLFTMMVLMALATTFATTPVLDALLLPGADGIKGKAAGS